MLPDLAGVAAWTRSETRRNCSVPEVDEPRLAVERAGGSRSGRPPPLLPPGIPDE